MTPTGRLTANQVNERVDDFLVAHHAAVQVNDGGRDHGQIRAFNNRTFDVARTVPTIILRNEDFGRIWRLLADQRDVQLEVERREPHVSRGDDGLQHRWRRSPAPTRPARW